MNLFKFLKTLGSNKGQLISFKYDSSVPIAVREWTIILITSAALLSLIVWFSTNRFWYWVHIEERMPTVGEDLVVYDTMSLQSIIEKLNSQSGQPEEFVIVPMSIETITASSSGTVTSE